MKWLWFLLVPVLAHSEVMLVLGPPASGKGTQCRVLSEKTGLPHISTGALLRQEIERETPLGLEAQSYVTEGRLVPQEIIDKVLFSRLSQPDCEEGYFLDGYPRSLEQAEALDTHLGARPYRVLFLTAPDSLLIERISGRRVCSACQRSYHLQFAPPKEEGSCTECGSELVQREDDTPEAAEKRLFVYHRQTMPLLIRYQEKGVARGIDATGSIEEVTAAITRFWKEKEGAPSPG